MDLLRALGTFVRVVETGSFSAVAREENSNHSAVTRLVSQLEEHFSVRLFHRSTRRLSLTEDGEDLLGQARHVLEAATDLEDTLMGRHGTPTGRVRVGLPVGAAMLLTPRIGALLDQYPGLVIELVVRDTFDDMIEERLDVALRLGQLSDASLVTRTVGTFGFALVAAPAYLERSGAPTAPEDLLHHACVIHDVSAGSARWRFNGPEGPHEIEVSSAFRANNSEVVRHAVLSGLGIGRLPEAMVVDDIRAGRLYRVLPDFPSEPRQGYLVYPSRRHLPPRTRLVIDFLVERFAALDKRLADSRVWGENETVWLV
jgi:DNA-binding transcriptional LysR family regulator